jgi:hypothetical protein
MKIFTRLKHFVVEVLFGRVTREVRYRKRLKEMRKRDPFIYK